MEVVSGKQVGGALSCKSPILFKHSALNFSDIQTVKETISIQTSYSFERPLTLLGPSYVHYCRSYVTTF